MLPFKFDGNTRTFQGEHKLRSFMTTQSTLQKILRYYLHVKKKDILSHEYKEGKDKLHKQS